MMNLNKFTKAELINKLRKSDTKSDSSTKLTLFNQIKSYLYQIWNLIVSFKNILLKLTLISFFIQIFKKYRIFRTLWKIINTTVLSIFGISLLDNFGFEFLSNFLLTTRNILSDIIEYLSNTQFSQYLNKLFSKEEIPSTNQDRSIIHESNKEKTRNHTKIGQNDRNPKISEWIKPETKTEEIESSNVQYYIIAVMIIGCLSWYYFDDIKDIGSSFMDWVKSFRGNDDPGNNNLPVEDRISQRAELEKYIKERTRETNEKISSIMIEKSENPVRITSESLEDLNEKVKESWESQTSPTSSTSSTETIKPSSSKVKIDSVFPLKENFIDNIKLIEETKKIDESKLITDKLSILDLKDDWKKILKSDLRESINYVENHLPKNEIDDTTYINELIEEIHRKNLEYLKDLNAHSEQMKLSKLIYMTDIGKNTDKWIDKMRKEISKFE